MAMVNRKNALRDREIAYCLFRGRTRKQLAEEYGVTQDRIDQVIKNEARRMIGAQNELRRARSVIQGLRIQLVALRAKTANYLQHDLRDLDISPQAYCWLEHHGERAGLVKVADVLNATDKSLRELGVPRITLRNLRHAVLRYLTFGDESEDGSLPASLGYLPTEE